MSKKIAIIGASGHGKVVANIAKLNGYDEIVFLDDDINKNTCGQYEVIGTTKDILKFNDLGYELTVAIGDNQTRERIFNHILEVKAEVPCLVHPNAVVDDSADIQIGTVIMANAVVNASSLIGKSCIINTGATIDHDCTIHDFVHISPGAHLAGFVEIDTKSWVCIGSNIIHQVRVGRESIVAAGSIVTSDVPDNVMVVGCPAKVKKNLIDEHFKSKGGIKWKKY